MPSFQYKAIDAEGISVTGEIQAEHLQQALALLESKGLTVVSLTRSDVNVLSSSTTASAGKLAWEESLRQYLHGVLQKAQSLVPALQAFEQESHIPSQRRDLNSVIQALQKQSIEKAVESFQALPQIWIPLLGVLQSADDSHTRTREFLEEVESAAEVRRQWRNALIQPMLLIVAAMAVMTLLSYLVIPVFREIYQDFGLTLPALTELVLTISDYINQGWILLMLGLAITMAFMALGGRRIQPKCMRSFLEATWGRRMAVSRVASYTAELMTTGLSTAESLQIAGGTCAGRRTRESAWELAQRIKSGLRVNNPRERSPLGSLVPHAILTEIPDTARGQLLREISSCYAERTRRKLSWTQGFLEPISIASVGLIVIVVLIALFSPLVTLVTALA